MIRKVAGGYKLVSKKTGKPLSKVTTKAGAEKRERQVEYFKHVKKALAILLAVIIPMATVSAQTPKADDWHLGVSDSASAQMVSLYTQQNEDWICFHAHLQRDHDGLDRFFIDSVSTAVEAESCAGSDILGVGLVWPLGRPMMDREVTQQMVNFLNTRDDLGFAITIHGLQPTGEENPPTVTKNLGVVKLKEEDPPVKS